MARKPQFHKTPSTPALQGKQLSFQIRVVVAAAAALAVAVAAKGAKQMKEGPKVVHSFHSQNPLDEMKVEAAAALLAQASPLAFPKRKSNAAAASSFSVVSAAGTANSNPPT